MIKHKNYKIQFSFCNIIPKVTIPSFRVSILTLLMLLLFDKTTTNSLNTYHNVKIALIIFITASITGAVEMWIEAKKKRQ